MSGDARRYAVSYDDSRAHRHLVGLLEGRSERGLVVDLGGGHAPHAERLVELGFRYAGLDTNDVALDEVRGRGHVALRCDLRDLADVERALDDLASTDDVVAVTAIDVIEHLVEPDALLGLLHRWMRTREVPVLGLSVPNVAHQDLGIKLLTGRWDVTPTGLLDATHLRFLTDESLRRLLTAAGFREVARDDVATDRSDQCWPEHAPAIAASTPLGGFLRAVRHLADRHAETYQFVRLYEPDLVDATGGGLLAPMGDAPLISVVLTDDATNDRIALDDVLAALEPVGALDEEARVAIEVVADAELVRSAALPEPGPVVAVDLRSPTRPDGGRIDRLVDRSRGAYLVLLDGSATLGRGWAEAMASAIARRPGSVVTAGSPTSSAAVTAVPSAVVRGLALGDRWSDRHTAALVEAVGPLCGTTRVELPDGAIVTTRAGADRPDPGDPPIWSLPALVDPAWAAERDALRRRVDELERWSASLAADNDGLNAELRRLPVRVVRRCSAVVGTLRRSVRRR